MQMAVPEQNAWPATNASYFWRNLDARARMGRYPVISPSQSTHEDAGQWRQLIQAVAVSRDREAFAKLFDYFAPRIKSVIQRSGASEASAEEIVQETMLTIWRKAHLFDPGRTASSWIFTIARNLRVDAVRREKRMALDDAELEFDNYIDDSASPDLSLDAARSEQRVEAAMAQLSNEQMRVVELAFFEGKSHGEIAEALQIPLGTVKSRLRLAMSRLRALVGNLS